MLTARTPNSRTLGAHRAAGIARYHETKLKVDIAKDRPLFHKAWKKYRLDLYVVTDISYNTGKVVVVNLKNELQEIDLLTLDYSLHDSVLFKEQYPILRELQKTLGGSTLMAGDLTPTNIRRIEANPWVVDVKRGYYRGDKEWWRPRDTGLHPSQMAEKGLVDRYGFNRLGEFVPLCTFKHGTVFKHEGVVAINITNLILGRERMYKERGDKLIEFAFLAPYFETPADIARAPSFQMHGRIYPGSDILFTARVRTVDEVFEHWDHPTELRLVKWGVDPYSIEDRHYCCLAI